MQVILTSLVMLLLYMPVIAQDFALEQLEASPRHHEWVKLEVDGKTLHAFVAFPEKSTKTQAVIVLHENRGLTDWVRSFADQVAAAGYLAIAPDLLSEFDENISKTSDFENSDKAREAIYQLQPDAVTNSLDAVHVYIANNPASNGNVAVIGFCWGGSQSFRYATNNPDLNAAFVFYGTAPDNAAAFETIDAPVYGFYGENDQRVNATIAKTEERMSSTDNAYFYEIYDGAGHAYMRSGDDPEGTEENKAARDASWERLKRILEDLN